MIRLRAQLWIAVSIAALCRISLATLTYGTNDASMLEASAASIAADGGISIYDRLVEVRDPEGRFLHGQVFNHPPFIVYLLRALAPLERAGIPVRVSLRLLDTAADAATVFLTASIPHIAPDALILVALAPPAILIAGFHANTDPLMVFLLMLSVWLIEVRGRVTAGLAAFTLASGIKIVPLLLLPALLLYMKSWKQRIGAILLPCAFWLITAVPWLQHAPSAMARNIFGYGSSPGRWGIGLLLRIFMLPGDFFNANGRWFLLLALLAASWVLHRRRATLFRSFGTLLFLFLLLTPGFGIQYLAWGTPFVTILPLRAAILWTVVSGAFCAAAYTFWSGGIPWYFANAIEKGTWGAAAGLLSLVAWLACALPFVPRPLSRSSPEWRTRAQPAPLPK